MGGKGWDSSLQEGASHTHIHLDLDRVKFYLVKKKKKVAFRYSKDISVTLFWYISYSFLYYYLRDFSCLESLFFFGLKMPLQPYIYAEIKLKDNSVKIQL